ncbi:MAG: hypothetical protein RBR66_03850 [Candidatus Izemoplasmatales bacterium]|jgi:hypothetical protein|nr:hypothetical protein [Candidatus Izemoplasmatales bacterium]
MATYKKGFKKQNPELLLLKTIVAIILAVLVIVGITALYATFTRWQDYKNYENIDYYTEVFDMVDSEDEELQDYVIYVYGVNDETSQNIKLDVLKIGNKIDDEMFFLLNADILTSNSTEQATKDSEKAAFLATLGIESLIKPMLIIVNDGEYSEKIVGTNNILDTLAQIEEGTFEGFN